MAGTSDDSAADSRLAERLTEIAVRASAEILAVDFRSAGTRLKGDNSPVTHADEAAHTAIMDGLAQAVPDVPVISEEAAGHWHGRSPPDEFLLVDPLDGTVEFLHIMFGYKSRQRLAWARIRVNVAGELLYVLVLRRTGFVR